MKDIYIQQDKKIVLGGTILDNANGCPEFLVRLKSDGMLDSEFANQLYNAQPTNSFFRCVSVTKNNIILVGRNTTNELPLTQLDNKGDTIDNSSVTIFSNGSSDVIYNCIRYSNNDQIIIGGLFHSVNGVIKPSLAKVSLNGDVDEYFKYDVNGRIVQFFEEDSTHIFVAGEFNRIGNVSGLFCIARINVNFPNEPANLKLDNSKLKSTNSGGIVLKWEDRSDNESGFSIEKSTDKKHYQKIASVGNNIFSYIDKDIIPDKRYYYRIKAYNLNGGSSYSNIAETNYTETDSQNIKVTPNPGNGIVQILLEKYDMNKITCSVYNSIGKCCFKKDYEVISDSYIIPVDLSKESQGLYIIEIVCGQNSKSTKLIKI